MSKPRFKPIKKIFQLDADRSKDVLLGVFRDFSKRHNYTCVEKRENENTRTYGSYPSLGEAISKFDELSAIYSVKAAEAGNPHEYEQKKTGRMIPCPGEAHSNPFIDNCGICMPGWGEVEELAPIDIEDAKKRRLDLPAPDLDDAQMKDMMAREKAGEVKLVSVRRGNTFYSVYRWTGK